MVARAGLALPYVQARWQNLVWNKTGNRHLRFRSRLNVRAFVAMRCRHVLWLVLTLGLYWPWAAVAAYRMRVTAVSVRSRVELDVLKSAWPSQGEGDPGRIPGSPEAAQASS